MDQPGKDLSLAFERVSKAFRTGRRVERALQDVSLSLGPGQVCGLVGPDGAGKTTLMRLAAGLLRPDQGRIQVVGLDVARDPLGVQALIGYMPQRFGLYEELSVRENLDLYADLQAVPRAERAGHQAELLRRVGLDDFPDRLAGQLSGGMKQKLGLACALVRAPRLLLLDEPTVGVDPVSRRELWRIIDGLVREQGVAVLISTAYLDEAERCDQVFLLHQGRLLGQGSPGSFSEPLQGRSFLVDLPGVSRRALQRRLADLPGVLDATVQSERVRVVMESARAPDLSALGAQATAARIEATSARLEDAFVSRLRAGGVRPARGPSPHVPAGAADGREVTISVEHAQRRFGDFHAVRDISFEVRRGEVFGLLGANGAGKTTTFRMLCGLLPASAGRLRVAGHDLRRAAAQARARIGYMAQRFSLYANLSVQQNLRFFASAYGLARQAGRDRIEWALQGFDLARYADTPGGELPLGYKQRLALAAALMHQPEILFLDEPTSGMDPLARREFWQQVNGLAEAGVTVLVTTHFMEEANFCDRLLIMAEGETLAEGTPAQMKARFRSRERPDPSMEDAFIELLRQQQDGRRVA